MTHASDVRVVFVTVGDKEKGLALARQVVEEGLAACGNVLPDVTSVFEWEGSMREEAEVLLILKTSAGRAARLTERVAELHTYDVPEVLTLVVEGGHEPYLEWVRECTRAESSNGQKEPKAEPKAKGEGPGGGGERAGPARPAGGNGPGRGSRSRG